MIVVLAGNGFGNALLDGVPICAVPGSFAESRVSSPPVLLRFTPAGIADYDG